MVACSASKDVLGWGRVREVSPAGQSGGSVQRAEGRWRIGDEARWARGGRRFVLGWKCCGGGVAESEAADSSRQSPNSAGLGLGWRSHQQQQLEIDRRRQYAAGFKYTTTAPATNTTARVFTGCDKNFIHCECDWRLCGSRSNYQDAPSLSKPSRSLTRPSRLWRNEETTRKMPSSALFVPSILTVIMLSPRLTTAFTGWTSTPGTFAPDIAIHTQRHIASCHS